jgi:hypothetical protein
LALIKVTEKMREAARRVLARHNAGEADRVEARYEIGLAQAEWHAQQLGMKVNKAHVRENAAREDPEDKDTRKRLEVIVNGTRKLVDADWWRKTHGDSDRAKRDKIAALADPARNPNEHERQVAERKLKAANSRRAPGIRPEPPPLPKNLDDWVDHRKPRKSKKSKTPQAPKASQRSLSDSSPWFKAMNGKRAAARLAKRTGLKCQTCGNSLVAQRVTARFCSVKCRVQSWRRDPVSTT